MPVQSQHWRCRCPKKPGEDVSGIKTISPSERLHSLTWIEQLFVIGETTLLEQPLFALFCSVKCPASIILKTYDLAQKLKTQATPIISGFHSPVEKEVLITLLRGTVPIIVCPARSIHKMRIPAEWKVAIDDGRLLILSPFDEEQNRPTRQTAELRNEMIAHLASQVFIAYAEPEGKTEAFAQKLLANQCSVLTYNSDLNNNLLEAGSKPIQL